MTQETEKSGQLLPFGRGAVRFRVEPHPEEIIDVAPEVIATMNARLRGEALEDVYSRDDQATKEFLVQNEVAKLRRVFGSAPAVFGAFSSLASIKEVRKELASQDVNRGLLASFVFKKSGSTPIDEVDAYAGLLGACGFRSKCDRLAAAERSQLLDLLARSYVASHFEPLQVTREHLQAEPYLRDLLRRQSLTEAVDTLLLGFYGVER